MKKLIALLIGVMIAFSLVACGDPSGNTGGGGGDSGGGGGKPIVTPGDDYDPNDPEQYIYRSVFANSPLIIDNELHAFAPAGLETTPYTIPTGVETILQQAFLGCDIQTITIPSSVKVIGNSAFKGASLANLYIEEGLEEITYFAFANCYSLTNITLPKSLKTLWDYAFDSCTQLESIYCPSTTPPAIKVEEGDEWGAFSNTHENLQIYVPIGSEEAYATADGWKNYADKIVGYDFSAEE